MQVKELAQILGQEIECGLPIQGFAADSRKVQIGFVFFALPGEKVDGHTFIEEARDRGAILAIVDQAYQVEVSGIILLRVPNVLQALHALAAWQVKNLKLRTVAITGSVGKTTTKEFLFTLLQDAYVVDKTPGNQNSQVGLPLHLLSLSKAPQIFIAEMGMSRKGEIRALASILPPEIALITQVGLAHTEYFPGGLEEVAEAKAEILSHPFTKKVFLHEEVSHRKAFEQRQDLSQICYGKETAQAFFVQEGQGWKIVLHGEESPVFTLSFSAEHLRDNFLGAALVAKELGLTWEEIFKHTHKLTPYAGRFETVIRQGILCINDSYNASPSSMVAALQNIPHPQGGGKVIAVLGHMGELGAFSESSHRLVGKVAAQYVDELFCLGKDAPYILEEFLVSGKKAHMYTSLADCKEAVWNIATSLDVVLIKASNSLELWKILEEDHHESYCNH